jgi:hypothetical protein
MAVGDRQEGGSWVNFLDHVSRPSRPGWYYQQLDAGREFRNRVVYGNQHRVLPPVFALSVTGGAHQAVAALFPDDEDLTRPQLLAEGLTVIDETSLIWPASANARAASTATRGS